MNRLRGALAALLTLTVLPTWAADETAEQKAIMTVVHQHMVLNFVSAIYYCENKHWPADVAAVHAFQDELKITLPVPPDWTLIESSLAYSVSEDTGEMTVHSEKDIVPDAHPVTSTNQTPVCTGKNIEMRPHLNIGE